MNFDNLKLVSFNSVIVFVFAEKFTRSCSHSGQCQKAHDDGNIQRSGKM